MDDDPKLSRDTRERLAGELDDITERKGTTDEVPEAPAVKRAGVFAERGALIVSTFFVALIVGVVASAWAGNWWLLVLALVLHAIGTLVVLFLVAGLLSESEHASPELAEQLRADGVSAPDRLLTDLAEERRGEGHSAS
jgi:MFS family permease